MLLHEQHSGAGRVHRDAMNAVTDFGGRIRNMLGSQSLIDGAPRFASIVGPERACGRYCYKHPFRATGIDQDRVQTHSACAWRPMGSGAVLAEAREFLPVLSAIGCAEYRGIFHAGVYRIRVAEGRLKMPDPLEFPGMWSAVIPLVSAGNAVIHELVPYRLPRLAAIIRTLDLLAKPAAGLRGVNSVWINGRTLQMLNFPTSKKRATDIPVLTFAV